MSNVLNFNDAKPQAAFEGESRTEPQGPDREEVKGKLLDHLESTLCHLFPQGFVDPKGREFFIGDTLGSAGESLRVELIGPKKGLWYDFATGEGGDVLDLWKASRGLPDFPSVLTDAADFTGASTQAPRQAPRRNPSSSIVLGRATATYQYRDLAGNLIAEVERFDGEKDDGTPVKAFRPWDVARKRHMAPSPRPLYRLPDIAGAPEIVFVEGEKCADALNSWMIPATTAMSGSNAPPGFTDWSIVQGRKVVIWPDKDQAGWNYAQTVREAAINAGARSVEILMPPDDKPMKWDAADAIAEGENPRDLIRRMRQDGPAETDADDDNPFVDHGNVRQIDWGSWTPIDFSQIERTEWVYGLYARGYTRLTFAAPKAGKSLLSLAEAVDAATGRGFLTGWRKPPRKVVYYNAEDDMNVIQARIAALCIKYGIDQSELVGQLWPVSGVEEEGFYLVSGEEGIIREDIFQGLEAFIDREGIDLVMVDPLQDLSDAPETNEVFRRLGRRLRKLATEHHVALGIVHHTRKPSAGVAPTLDDARGGSALRGTSRANRLLVPMSKDEAGKFGITEHWRYVQIADEESNLAPPTSDAAIWYEKQSIEIPNGQNVGVIVPWTPPDAFEDVTPQDARAVQAALQSGSELRAKHPANKKWVGKLVARTLGLDLNDKADDAKVKSLISGWIQTDVLREGEERDKEKGRNFGIVMPGENIPTSPN